MTETSTEPKVVTVKPWPVMTPIEQAHHLVHEHGFNQEYFWRGDVAALAALDSPAAVLDAFVNERCTEGNTGGGYSYPHPNDRDHWHEGDHNGDGTERGGDLFDSGIGTATSTIKTLHVHLTPVGLLQERYPLGCAIAVDREGKGEDYLDGWVVGYDDNGESTGLIVKPDTGDDNTFSNPGLDSVSVVAGPVVERWEAVSRLGWGENTPMPDLTTEQQVEWLLRAVTNEYADPSQRTDDLRTLAELIAKISPVVIHV